MDARLSSMHHKVQRRVVCVFGGPRFVGDFDVSSSLITLMSYLLAS